MILQVRSSFRTAATCSTNQAKRHGLNWKNLKVKMIELVDLLDRGVYIIDFILIKTVI